MKIPPIAVAVAVAVGVALIPASVPATTHFVSQTGISFVPDDLTIDVGDTVVWQWSAGIHTVTEGTDDMNPPLADKLFDEPLATGNPAPSYTFTEAGDYPYYCRPHRTVGMVGIIRVQGATSAEEVATDTWSRVKSHYR